MIITKKIQVLPEESCKEDFYNFFRELDKIVYRIKNRCMQTYWFGDACEQVFSDKFKEEVKNGKKSFDSEWYQKNLGTSKQNLGYRVTSEYDIASHIRTAISNTVWQDYKNDYKDVMFGKKSIRNYRYGCPIPFKKSCINKFREEGFLFFKFNMIFAYGVDKSGNRKTIQQVIDGTFKMCDSAFRKVGKKVFLYLVLDVPEKNHALAEDVSLTVDLSFKYPLYITNSKNSERLEIGNIQYLQKLRMQLKERYERFQSSLSLCKGGKGRKKKLKALGTFEEKEKNIAKTLTHQVTAEIIKKALKLQAKTIYLTGEKNDIAEINSEGNEERKKFIHRFWGYHQIISQIKYKANLNGMMVIDNFKNPDAKNQD